MKPRYLYLIALVVVVLDQASKFAVTARLPLDTPIPVIGNLVYLTSIRNPGGAFGSFQSATGLLTLITVATAIGIAVMIKRSPRLQAPLAMSLSLLLGGAVGNLIDRVRFHEVIDFIDLRVWPVFNLADCAITIAIAFLGYHILVGDRRRAALVRETKE